MENWKYIRLIERLIGYTISFGTFTVLKFVIWKAFAENFTLFPSLFLMFLSAVIIRWLVLYLYDQIKIDFWGFENIKYRKLHDENHTTKIFKWLVMKFGRFGIPIASFVIDPTMFVIYARPGYQEWNGFGNKTVALLFLLGNISGVLSWGNFIALIF